VEGRAGSSHGLRAGGGVASRRGGGGGRVEVLGGRMRIEGQEIYTTVG